MQECDDQYLHRVREIGARTNAVAETTTQDFRQLLQDELAWLKASVQENAITLFIHATQHAQRR